ncbi:carboxypeptidase-like regulatory domain-containing protein [Flavobacterium macacae]|uniref:TonB-dependent receptor n=1 Tax=Flavobacterium macacae TaxID=2488993 RepID=A0A3P3W3Y0_9FLAO|nr:carboxypeptidase-like regulatory domain-containing protein [Flavobacterium macacae]RRJ89801.1 TonB-dependent receptor [Flavobacterium macacae]
MKKLVISMLFVMQVVFAFAQQNPLVKGKVVDAKTQKPLQNVVATLQNTTLTILTNSDGIFVFPSVPTGTHLLEISSTGFTRQILSIDVEDQPLDIGIVVLEEDIKAEQQLSLITITENDLGDDNSGSESTAGLLQASRDAFQQAAAFNWGQSRFRIRGLDNEYGATMINGVTMNKIYDGRPQWSNWGGLNDATRNQEFTMGSGPSDYTFGSILGTQEINTRASFYRPGSRVSFSGTNTNYSWRMMATHASGMNEDGWAYVISAGRRWADEGYFEGTDYSANSFFASVEKKFNDNHSLNFTSIFAQNSRGKNSPNTQEVTDLVGEEYNSYWGWQNGKKRNSRDKDVEEPILMLSHYWKINDKNSLNTNVAYQFGSIGNSRLDFNGAANPDPTYYRNLPSYFSTNGATAEVIDGQRNFFLSNRQINWDAIYYGNTEAVTNSDNIEIGRRSKESGTILYEDRTDDKQWTVSSILNSQLSDNIILNAGGTYRKLRSQNFQNVLDLLGGSFYSDLDPFLVGERQQSDLDNPNRKVGVGDKFGYNYILNADIVDAFTQFKFSYTKFDFYMAQNYTRTQYQREGLYRNGNYENNSKGKSEKVSFENFGFKGGLTYKLTGRHLFDVNAAYMTKAPTMRNTFPNARMNNNIVTDLQSEKIMSVDASYIIRAPKLKARITGYYSTVKDATDIGFYFAEGLGVITPEGTAISSNGNAFVAEIVTGMNRKNMGGELGLEYQLTQTIKLTGTAAYGQYTFDNNPNVKLSVDNIRQIINFGGSTMKDYKQPGMPQQAYGLGIEYRDPKFWWIGANANYLADNYSDISPLLRTNNFFINPDTNAPFVEATEEGARALLKQEKFDPTTLVNLVGGKSWRIDGKTVGFFASVNNVFDVTYKTGGFEQARNANYRELQEDYVGGTRSFGPKYFYGYGRTYFINLYLNF